MYYNNRKLALSIFWIVLGATLMGLSMAGALDSDLYSGMGGALIVVGAMQVYKNLKYRRDPEYRERLDTEAKDERNAFIRMRSWAWTGYITILALSVGTVAALILGQQTIQMTLMYTICLIVGVYWIAYVVLSRKY